MSIKNRTRRLELTTLEAREVPAVLTAPAILKQVTLIGKALPAQVSTVSTPSASSIQVANTTLKAMPTAAISGPASTTGINVSKDPGARVTLPTASDSNNPLTSALESKSKSALSRTRRSFSRKATTA